MLNVYRIKHKYAAYTSYPESGADKVKILRASGEGLTLLEQEFGVNQVEVVDDLIENSCWSNDAALRDFTGGRGTGEQRLAAILNAIDNQ